MEILLNCFVCRCKHKIKTKIVFNSEMLPKGKDYQKYNVNSSYIYENETFLRQEKTSR